eukprot:CAMPEP_0194291436 /NCGR_PEP_ID=MMETSP0169-20130528/43381_1 /TAXON_ID=218684 /ORGANISM="Corethron pennatum, Strain L29A3" /LENGTH=315 /DNA_ID=CAMNT_0039039311 /DNA_START=86 /DNA_END=1033 /DNA_ORIENTATION=+
MGDRNVSTAHLHWTEAAFESGCVSLMCACGRVKNNLGERHGDSSPLLDWKWASSRGVPRASFYGRGGGNGSPIPLWMIHPPIVVMESSLSSVNPIGSRSAVSGLPPFFDGGGDSPSPDRFPEYDYEEEVTDFGSYVDAATFIVEAPMKKPSGPQSPPPPLVEWSFDIVYSPTWRVPILYFRARRVDDGGTPLSREHFLRLLDFKCDGVAGREVGENGKDDGRNDRAWNFLSEEEHPITGAPSFFLHPCRTSECVGRLRDNYTKGQAAAKNDSAKISGDASPSGLEMLLWLSLVLPAVKFSFPPNIYLCLAEYFGS